MSEHLHNIDKLFRDAIEGQEEMPSPNLWNELDQQLDKRTVASISGKYNKLKWVAAALFLVSVGMGMYAYRVRKTAEVVQAGKKIYPPTTTAIPGSPLPGGGTVQRGGNQANTPVNQADMATKEAGSPQSAGEPSSSFPPVAKVSSPVKLSGGAGAAVSNQTAGILAPDRTPPKSLHPARESAAYTRSPVALADRYLSGSSGEIIKKDRKAAAGITIDRSSDENGEKPGEHSSVVSGVMGSPRQNMQHASVAGLFASDSQQPIRAVTRVSDPSASLPPPQFQTLIAQAAPAHLSGPVHLTPKHPAGITATFFYSRALFSTHVTNNTPYNPSRRFPEDDSKSIREKEDNGASWSFGAQVDYRFNSHWSVGSGFSLLSRVTMIQSKMIFARPDEHGNVKYRFNCSSGYSFIDLKTGAGNQLPPGGTGPFNNPNNGDTARAVSSSSKLQYLSVPLVMKYHFGEGRLSFNTGFGVQANFLTSRKIETSITKGNNLGYANTSDIQGLRSMYMSGILSAAAVYTLTKNVAITVMPHTQVGFMSINQQAPIKSYVNFYGISTGVSIKL